MTSKQTALETVKELVERFNEQLPAYKKTDYNETQTRRDFIDPFFKALGWDIDNKQGAAESYREVIHEDKINQLVYQLYDLSEEEIKIVETN